MIWKIYNIMYNQFPNLNVIICIIHYNQDPPSAIIVHTLSSAYKYKYKLRLLSIQIQIQIQDQSSTIKTPQFIARLLSSLQIKTPQHTNTNTNNATMLHAAKI
jgi:hypothetical protein